jgi:hypothetical protein
MKKINYKELAESYETLIDKKNKELNELENVIDGLINITDEDEEIKADLRKEILNLKIDRIGLAFLVIFTLIFLILK